MRGFYENLNIWCKNMSSFLQNVLSRISIKGLSAREFNFTFCGHGTSLFSLFCYTNFNLASRIKALKAKSAQYVRRRFSFEFEFWNPHRKPRNTAWDIVGTKLKCGLSRIGARRQKSSHRRAGRRGKPRLKSCLRRLPPMTSTRRRRTSRWNRCLVQVENFSHLSHLLISSFSVVVAGCWGEWHWQERKLFQKLRSREHREGFAWWRLPGFNSPRPWQRSRSGVTKWLTLFLTQKSSSRREGVDESKFGWINEELTLKKRWYQFNHIV